MLENQSKNEILTIIICASLIVLGGLALENDIYLLSLFNQKDRTEQTEAIGKVVKFTSNARHKSTENIFWTDIKKNTKVGSGDSIFVGPESSTTIRFNDGKSLTIGANSLIKFNTDQKSIKLKLEYGSIKSNNLPSEIILDDCGKNINIQSQKASLEIGKSQNCGEVEIKADKGIVKLNDQVLKPSKVATKTKIKAKPLVKLAEKPVVNLAVAQLEKMDKRDLASLKTEELVKIQKPLVAPVLKNDKITINGNSQMGAQAEWITPDQEVSFIFEVSENPDFTSAISYKTNNFFHPIPIPQNFQNYFRVKSFNAKTNKESSFSNTGILKVEYSNLQFRESEILINHYAKTSKEPPQSKKVNLSWTDLPLASKYVLQIDTSPNFTQPRSLEVDKNSIQISIPKPGQYYVQVLALNKYLKQISKTEPMGTIIYNRIFNLQKPTLNEDTATQVFFYQKTVGDHIVIDWSSAPLGENETFRVEVSRDPQFKDLVKEANITSNQIVVDKVLEIGKYFWRVRKEKVIQTNKEQEQKAVSDWSNYGIIEIVFGKL